jgi:hypothetical protein
MRENGTATRGPAGARGFLLAFVVAIAFGACLAPAALGADSVYWANTGDGTIRVANLDGTGSASTLFGGESTPLGVAINPAANKIYWSNFSTGAIRVANLDGTGSASNLFTGESTPLGVAIDPAAGRIYWANNTASGAIRVANLNGSGSATNLFVGESNPRGVAINPAANKIYWSTFNTGAIRVANLDGTGSAFSLFTGESTPLGIAIDPVAGRIYWANQLGNAIRVANLTGGSASSLFTGESTPDFPALLRAPAGTGAPAVSGVPKAGEQLSCSQGSWAADLQGAFFYRSPRSFDYQWRKDGADIAGAASSTYTPTEPADYSCRVTATNQAGSMAQTSAPVTVSTASPTLTTDASPDVTVGGDVHDTSILAGGSAPTGTITFTLYGPDDSSCSGTPAFTDTKPVSGNAGYDSADFTPTEPGTYRWTADYSGDSNNDPAQSACNAADESVTVSTASPTLTTDASPNTTIGHQIRDTAQLTQGASPTGTITFRIFGPEDDNCTGPPVFTSTKTVSGNGGYPSDKFKPTRPGIYHWTARYSGDVDNVAVTKPCSSKKESTWVEKASPTLDTTAKLTGAGRILDTAKLTGGHQPSGELAFKLYGPGDANCSRPPVFTDRVTVSGNGGYQPRTFNPTAQGTYRFTAVLPGDANNRAARSDCNAAGESVTVR